MAFNGKRRKPKPVTEVPERRRNSVRRIRNAEIETRETAEELRRWRLGLDVDPFPETDSPED